MSFKIVKQYLCSLSLVAGLGTGCAKHNEMKAQPIVVNKSGGSDCITNVKSRVSAFMAGNLSPKDTASFWHCLGQTINQFATLTSGDGPQGSYTPQAIRQFINHYFTPGQPLDQGLFLAIMPLKRVLLGGGVEFVTHEELERLQIFITKLRDVSLELQPHMSLISNSSPAATDAEVHRAGVAVEGAIKQLGAWLEEQHQDYSFPHLSDLIAKLNGSPLPGELSAILVTLKAMLIGGEPSILGADEWRSLSDTLGKGFYLYLAVTKGFADNLDDGLSRATLPAGLERLVDVLARASYTAEIPVAMWHRLFALTVRAGWLPSEFTVENMMALWNWVLFRLLGDGMTPVTGFNANHAQMLRHKINGWSSLRNFTPLPESSPLLREFEQLLADSPSVLWDARGRMVFPLRLPGSHWSEASRKHMVWPFVLLRWLKETYVSDDIVSLTEEHVNGMVEEILPLLQNFGWLPETKLTVGARLLREADLFTTVSNGNERLEITEAVRYLTFVVSSYRSAQIWLASAAQNCELGSVACLRDLAVRPDRGILHSMPRLKSAMESWETGRFSTYMQQAEQACLGEALGSDGGKVPTGDLLEVWQLFQYVEIFMQRFDTDYSETIDPIESQVAFNVYGPTLGKLTGTSDHYLLVFFTYLMKYGDTPMNRWGGAIEFQRLFIDRSSWVYASDRAIFMGILHQLSNL